MRGVDFALLADRGNPHGFVDGVVKIEMATPWTMETVTAGLARFYHEIAGVGLVFPSAVRPLERVSQPSTPPPWVRSILPQHAPQEEATSS